MSIFVRFLDIECIIHQAAHCGKLSVTLKEIMDSTEFKEFLPECDSVHFDLLQYNNVHWISKGQVTERFWQIKEEIMSLEKTLAVDFLKCVLKHLNALSTELQGNGRLICDLIKVSLLSVASSISLKKSLQVKNFFTCQQFLNRNSRFEVSPAAEWMDVAMKLVCLLKLVLQMEIIDLQEDISLQMYKTASAEIFGINMSQKNMKIAKKKKKEKIVIYWATMFGSTYICEISFLKMNFLKSKYCSRLAAPNLEDTIRICCSPCGPNVKKLTQDSKYEGHSNMKGTAIQQVVSNMASIT
ncbi:uncharacterized protein LOC124798286 [Schistocerca piceifrons]|uniref:uncharacterized protein LOC124798286 n=1 Tax=Schistocerca piceifrons TaxID=274613 RepID=UPI001F5E48D5|nr:uncharacterized protein LOC124798286 [Schistocerca piceifrons]